MGILGEGMQASRDSPVLMTQLLVHLWQPGPDVCQVERTRASVTESRTAEAAARTKESQRTVEFSEIQSTQLFLTKSNKQLIILGEQKLRAQP